MLGVPEILNFYFTRIFPIQRTVAALGAAGGAAHDRHADPRATTSSAPSRRSTQQMEGMGPLLQDPKQSSIRIVLNPERMVINESQRLYTYLSLFGFPVDAVIANRVLPEEARSEYFDRWFDIQAGHLADGARGLRSAALLRGARSSTARWWASELLDEFGRRVFGDEDPTAVLFREKPMEVKKEGKGYALYIRLPFAEKDKIQVWTRGEELVVQVDNQRRHIMLPRTLAFAASAGRGLRGPAAAGGLRREGGPVSASGRAGPRRRPAAWSRRSSRRRASTARRPARCAVRSSRA